jgi:hypothetical protein
MALPNPCCCSCDILLIIISNSNSAIDDNFEIQLNGNVLGSIDNSTNTCTGRMFGCKTSDPLWPSGTDPTPSCSNLVGIPARTFCNSGICNFQSFVSFPRTDINLTGVNVLQIWATASGNNNNFGNVNVYGMKRSETVSGYELCKTYLSGNYSFASDSPGAYPFVGQSYTFTYS